MRHIDHLRTCVEIDGLDCVDVGAGDGSFAREMAALGGRVTGIEVSEDKVASANGRSDGNPSFLLGRGESLPLADGSQDLACFMFSFHHIEAGAHGAALAEAARVLRPKGRLHVCDPLPDEPDRNVMRELDDETEVRTISHARMARLETEGTFRLVSATEYERLYDYADADEFIAVLLRGDPGRAKRLPECRERLVESFRRVAERRDGRWVMPHPCRAYHFEVLEDRK